MQITRESMLSGKIRTLDLDITEEQMNQYMSGQGYIQDIFSNLSADEREFIKTGISADEWDATFAEPEDEE